MNLSFADHIRISFNQLLLTTSYLINEYLPSVTKCWNTESGSFHPRNENHQKLRIMLVKVFYYNINEIISLDNEIRVINLIMIRVYT